MDMLQQPIFWVELGAIIWINLLVSGDNAVMIALAARSLPPRQQRLAVFWGSAAAVALRIVLTVFAVKLLELPWLKLAGGLLLLWIGVKLLVPDREELEVSAHTRLVHAIRTILLADLVMSLDNVIAVAAAANAAERHAPVKLVYAAMLGASGRLILAGRDDAPQVATDRLMAAIAELEASA